MRFEVEQKFPVVDGAEIERRLTEMGARFGPPVGQIDLYYAHPARDFGQTDEALRIRRSGGRQFITYKGPKVDAITKTRREIELPLGADDDSAAAWGELLQALGFRPAAEVRKTRRSAEIMWQGERVIVALDRIESLGSFVELEIAADEATMQTARRALAALAAELGIGAGERRSYLELLGEKAQGPPWRPMRLSAGVCRSTTKLGEVLGRYTEQQGEGETRGAKK